MRALLFVLVIWAFGIYSQLSLGQVLSEKDHEVGVTTPNPVESGSISANIEQLAQVWQKMTPVELRTKMAEIEAMPPTEETRSQLALLGFLHETKLKKLMGEHINTLNQLNATKPDGKTFVVSENQLNLVKEGFGKFFGIDPKELQFTGPAEGGTWNGTLMMKDNKNQTTYLIDREGRFVKVAKEPKYQTKLENGDILTYDRVYDRQKGEYSEGAFVGTKPAMIFNLFTGKEGPASMARDGGSLSFGVRDGEREYSIFLPNRGGIPGTPEIKRRK